MIGATLDIQHRDDSAVVVVHGDLDSANAALLLTEIERRITARRPRAILDISDLDYFDSAGVHLVFRLARQLAERGGELVVVAPTGSIAGSALRHAGADSAFAFVDAVPAPASGPA